ncbi:MULTISPECIES: hypothetical protein [Cryobacterium]|uniref:Uncharacterized protein n=1 Tax=Cryobacterium mannosilyticum TaxID=1259190 RepID=A0A4R8WF70_9MICO|nr:MULTISPECIES: hypothetical protein [Cryobacterium]TFB93673.1 hypothetical protein E3O48_10580 [Cryobacterium sp. HLT2-28]TFC07590.1 hypothetical protein E3O32_01215 [Cryobacterium mannosilyticum]
MPSFRIEMTIGAVKPGVAPQSVLPAAAAAAAALTTVEASDLAVVAGAARATVRFSADDPSDALRIGHAVLVATGRVADPQSWRVTERIRGRWLPVR